MASDGKLELLREIETQMGGGVTSLSEEDRQWWRDRFPAVPEETWNYEGPVESMGCSRCSPTSLLRR